MCPVQQSFAFQDLSCLQIADWPDSPRILTMLLAELRATKHRDLAQEVSKSRTAENLQHYFKLTTSLYIFPLAISNRPLSNAEHWTKDIFGLTYY